jgi:hypothetical protein
MRIKYPIGAMAACLAACSAVVLPADSVIPPENELIGSRGPIPGVTANSAFAVYYGDAYYTNTHLPRAQWILNESTLSALARFDILVLQPGSPHFTPEIVAELKLRGVDHVIGYISIGEDFFNPSFESLMTGDGTGPYRYNAATGDLAATNGGIASFYVDVDRQQLTYNADGTINAVTTIAQRDPDGIADVNPVFKGYMVRPDAAWRTVLNNMRIGGTAVPARQNAPGLAQLAGARGGDLRNRSGNFGFDGFFLDTIDTAGPYGTPGYYPWTVDEMRDTVQYIHENYPNHYIVANRGGFYFTAGLRSPVTGQYPIDFSIRPYVNAVLFESFIYDSAPGTNEGPNGETEFYVANRDNILPKLLAEASRPDGFTVLSLDYAAGRSVPNLATRAFDATVRAFGLTEYLAPTGALDTISLEIANRLPATDSAAPTWLSTANTLDGAITPNLVRVGVQQVVATSQNTVVVRWDPAVDQSGAVAYDIRYRAPNGAITTLSNVAFTRGERWDHNPASAYANQVSITGLSAGTYTFWVIPKDAAGRLNETDPGYTFRLGGMTITTDAVFTDWNGVSPLITDGEDVNLAGDHMDWYRVYVTHDTGNISFRLANQMPVAFTYGLQMFIDSDSNRATGYIGTQGEFPIGADYLIQGLADVGIRIYPFNGATQTSWSWSGADVDSPAYSWQNGELELRVPHWQLQRPGYVGLANRIRFFLDGDSGPFGHANVHDFVPNDVYTGGYIEYQHAF